MVCIGFVVLTSTGLMQEIRHSISSVELTEAIPNIEEVIQSQVKKVIVQNYNASEIQVDYSQSSEQAVHVFGSYRYSTTDGENELKLPDSFASVHTIGDTMYVSILQPPRRNGIHSSYPHMDVTVIIPEGVTTEITGNHKVI